jgi:predicted Zn-ribbon and HTH transcriptional regulator
MAYFICPNCKNRSIDNDGREGLLDEPPSCQRCGFGFLFELLDDYYPAPAPASSSATRKRACWRPAAASSS